MATVEKEVKLCTKCGENPKAGDEKDKNPWCLECRSEYQKRRYQALDWRAERRGLIRGIQAMRESLSTYFRASGRAFMGPEVASIIDALPGPGVESEDARPKPQTP
jgi:hypothetical protein